ncbi:MAG: hypothetical protein ACOCVC_02680 [Spirochaeta sp.]
MIHLKTLISRDARILKLMVASGATVTARHLHTGKERTVPVRSLYLNNHTFYRSSHSQYEYLVDEDRAASLLNQLASVHPPAAENRTRQKQPAQDSAQETSRETLQSPAHPEAPAEPAAPATNFGSAYTRIRNMKPHERVSLIREHTSKLSRIAQFQQHDPAETQTALIEAGTDGAISNRSTILEALKLSNHEAKQYTSEIVEATNELIDATSLLVDGDLCHQELIDQVARKSNGMVIQHMTRVFLLGFSFLLYYNRQVLTSDLISKIRVRFAEFYKSFYYPLLTGLHRDYVTLERVFLGGMRALYAAEINQYATGFLVHDIGKVQDIEYHEGEEGYDREKVTRHVEIGFSALKNKTHYSDTVTMITGLHHEYYGARDGYGIHQHILQQHREKSPDRGEPAFPFVMSYDVQHIPGLQASAFFPAKMLEIVDIYDSLTDPNRRYRAPLRPVDAIHTLITTFAQEQAKIDPIILDIFLSFLVSKGVIHRSDIAARHIICT